MASACWLTSDLLSFLFLGHVRLLQFPRFTQSPPANLGRAILFLADPPIDPSRFSRGQVIIILCARLWFCMILWFWSAKMLLVGWWVVPRWAPVSLVCALKELLLGRFLHFRPQSVFATILDLNLTTMETPKTWELSWLLFVRGLSCCCRIYPAPSE